MGFFKQVWSALKDVSSFRARACGAAVVVAMGAAAVSITFGAYTAERSFIADKFRDISPATITIQANSTRYKLDGEVAAVILEKAPSLTQGAIHVSGPAQASYKLASYPAVVIGVGENYRDIYSLEMEVGSFINPLDISTNSRVAVIGTDIFQALFERDANQALSSDILVNGRRLQVIGVYQQQEKTSNSIIYVPFDVAAQQLLGVSARPIVTTEAKDAALVPDALYEIRLLLREHFLDSVLGDFSVVHKGNELILAERSAQAIVRSLTYLAVIALAAGVVCITLLTRLDMVLKQVKTRGRVLINSAITGLLAGLIGICLTYAALPLLQAFNIRYQRSGFGTALALLSVVITTMCSGYYVWYTEKPQSTPSAGVNL